MKSCENCGIEHDSSFGSGRFCCNSCSRSFSTKRNRKDINQKISKKLLLNKKDPLIKNCPVCLSDFEIEYGRRYQKCCSRKCSSKLGGSSKKKDTSRMGGIREGGGRAKGILYVNRFGEEMRLNSEEIEVAKILDKSNLRWRRNFKGFKYLTFSGDPRKFYPDFYINDIEIYLEYKGWLTDEMRHKMKDSRNRNDISLLIIVGKDPRFKNDGIGIEDFEIIIKNTGQLKEAAGLQNLA